MNIPEIKDIEAAAERIRPHIHKTPVLTSRTLNEMVGAELFFKCENLQKAGVFKIRGATNAVLQLSDEQAEKGVATHSSGNHAAALSLAARRRGIPAQVVMPSSAPQIKVDAVEGYGGRITFCEPTLQAREETLARLVEQEGCCFIHPYDNFNVVAGQGTAGLELLEQVPDLDLVMTPVGGGGLLSGTALSVAAKSPGTRVMAGEPSGADDAYRSMAAGERIPMVNPRTIADGLLTSLSEMTFHIISTHVEKILLADDEEIIWAMRSLWERMKIVVEPSAAVPLAALLARQGKPPGKRIGIILSGGNVDLSKLPW